MNDLGAIASGAGLQDGLNPYIFMTSAIFIVFSLWLKKNGLPVFSLRIVFILFYILGCLNFNFGPAGIIVFHKNFILAAKMIYFALSVWFFALGLFYLKDWYMLRRASVESSMKVEIGSKNINLFIGITLTVFVGVFLSALATLWPINNYIMLLGNETLLRGQWRSALPLLFLYSFLSVWPVWLVWVLFSIKNLKPTMLKILSASIFFIASTSMYFIFK